VLLAQIDPRTALLEQAGWQALAAGHAHDAADDFRNALTSDPGNARLHLGAGAAAYAEQRNADARAELERALSIDPQLTDARLLLAHVYYRLGDRLAAITNLQTVLVAEPRAADVRATLERWQRETDIDNRLNHVVDELFTVSYEGPSEEALASAALASLDRAYWRIGALFGTFPAQPIPVVLYTAEQFQDITRSPSWAAGAYDGIIRVPVRGALDKQSELDRVLAHEFTHALVHTLAPRSVPTWLNEGLATALEAEDLSWAGQVARQGAAPVPLRALAGGFSRLSGAQAQLAYATSALAARRLIEENGGPAVANLLRDLGDGADFDAAFLHRFNRSLADFEAGGF
jgi:tetratricopeptide (TPR) repeat protein